MVGEELWKQTWERIQIDSLKLAEHGLWPEPAIKRCLQVLPEMYGWGWVESAVVEGHPLTAFLISWPTVKYATTFVDLLLHLQAEGTSEVVVRQLVDRTRPRSMSAFWSTFEELRVLYCLNKVGLKTKKLPEYVNTGLKGKKGKAQDLEASLGDTQISVEVTQLSTTDNMRRANAAWDRITMTTMMHTRRWDGNCSLWLDCRPYSHRHVDQLESETIAASDRAKQSGLAVIDKPGLIKFVVWRDDRENEAAHILKDLGMEPQSAVMPLTWHSPIAPFRVVQKLNEKAKQASQKPWLLVIRAPDVLKDLDSVRTMVSDATEWLYDHPSLVGVVLYTEWDSYGPTLSELPNITTDEIIVSTTASTPQHWQQTVLLPNRFTDYLQPYAIYDKVLRAALETEWNPVFLLAHEPTSRTKRLV